MNLCFKNPTVLRTITGLEARLPTQRPFSGVAFAIWGCAIMFFRYVGHVDWTLVGRDPSLVKAIVDLAMVSIDGSHT